MFRYSDSSGECISLHDCRASQMRTGDRTLTFVFKDGIYILENNINNQSGTLCYTGEAEVVFNTLYKNTDENITVYVFTETDDENRAVRESVSPAVFADMLKSGMELEFLYSYKGSQSYLFECWLWSHTEPYHRECVIIISAENAAYYWNDMYPEE